MNEIPPPGPARDALVAKAMGCETWGERDGCLCPDFGHDVFWWNSTEDAPALAALRAWVEAEPEENRECRIDMRADSVLVRLWRHDDWPAAGVSRPTLPDAATAAILDATRSAT